MIARYKASLHASMKIQIVSTPPGDAPEHVRAAWIGLVLPITVAGPRFVETVGVLSRPKTWIVMFLTRLLGRASREEGYVVAGNEAVQILSGHAPEAAEWWRQNAPHWIQPGQYFLFSSDVCKQLEP